MKGLQTSFPGNSSLKGEEEEEKEEEEKGKRVMEEVSDAHFHGKTITEQIVVSLC